MKKLSSINLIPRLLRAILTLVAISFLVSCNQNKQTEENKKLFDEKEEFQLTFLHDNIMFLWETRNGLKIPESVLESDDYVFVSNINGKPSEKNNKGYISKLSKEGKIIEEKWITGLNAPKGMGTYNDRIYVSDIDRLVEIDLNNGTVLNSYPIENAIFLNDIDVSAKAEVFISDMTNNEIYLFKEGKLESWLKSEQLRSVNGLYVDDGFLMAGTENNILKINIDSKKIDVYIENTGPVDGLEAYGDGRYIYSDWVGHVYIAGPESEKILLLDTSKENINAADIWFEKETKVLYVPTFMDNRVLAYKLNCR